MEIASSPDSEITETDQPVEREPTPQRDQETNLFYTVQQEILVLYYELKKTNMVCRVKIGFILINRFNGICIITYVFKRGKVLRIHYVTYATPLHWHLLYSLHNHVVSIKHYHRTFV